MAQSGFTPILLYASGTPGNSPSAGNLTSSASGAELAVNYADGKLFYKDSGGSVQTLATKGTGSIGGSTTQVQYNLSGALAGSANLTFDGTTLTANSAAVSTGNLSFSGTAQRITGDMSNATLANRLSFQNNVTDGNTVIQALPNGTSLTSGINFFNSSTPTNCGQLNAFINGLEVRISSAIQGTGTYLPMTFYTGGSERMRIDTSGNVGVGTASPGYKLDVNGTANFASTLNIANTAWLTFGGANTVFSSSAGGGLILQSPSTSENILFRNSSGTERMRIDSSGNVGIGTASPNTLLHLYAATNPVLRLAGGADAGLYIDYVASFGGNITVKSNQPLVFKTNDAERARITATGNIVAGASAALATTATDGFLYVPTCAGTPTGTPTAITGMAPIVVNTTNNKLYFYSGGAWRDAGP